MIQAAALAVCLYIIVRYLEMVAHATGPSRVWLSVVAVIAMLLTGVAALGILVSRSPM